MTSPQNDRTRWWHAALSVLAKLGILRYGVKSYTYTSGRDRPAESLMPHVFNADRDLITAEDLRKVVGKAKSTNRTGL